MTTDPPIRKKMRRRDDPFHARYLTFSTYRRLALFGNARIRDRFAAHLAEARLQHRFELFAWVVMPEHVHLLVRPGPSTLVAALASLKTGFAKDVIGRWRDLDAPILRRLQTADGSTRFWQHGGGYDRNVFSAGEIEEKIDYIHHNPVARGLVKLPEDWAWSSARWYAGFRDDQVPIDRLRR